MNPAESACPRIGSQKLVQILEGWTQAATRPMRSRSSKSSRTPCSRPPSAAGQFLPAPIRSVMKHFRAEVDEQPDQPHCPAASASTGKIMSHPTAPAAATVQLTIDEKAITVPAGTTSSMPPG